MKMPEISLLKWQKRYGSDGDGAPSQTSASPDGWEESVWNDMKPAITGRLANKEDAQNIATSFGVDVSYIEACR